MTLIVIQTLPTRAYKWSQEDCVWMFFPTILSSAVWFLNNLLAHVMYNTVVLTVVVPTCFQIKFAVHAFPALHPFVSTGHELHPGGKPAPGQ